MIAFPRTKVPVPDGIALRIGRQLPTRVREAVAEVGLCGRLLAGRTLSAVPAQVRVGPAVRLHSRVAAANKVLAAYDPRLIHGWVDLDWRTR